MFLPYLKSTRFGCQFHSLFDHEQQVPQIFLGCCQPFNVITHPDQKNWASLIISSNEAVLAGGVDFLNQILIRADKVWSVAFIPLNPVPPHLQTLFPIEFPRHNKPRQCTEVGCRSLEASTVDGGRGTMPYVPWLLGSPYRRWHALPLRWTRRWRASCW